MVVEKQRAPVAHEREEAIVEFIETHCGPTDPGCEEFWAAYEALERLLDTWGDGQQPT